MRRPFVSLKGTFQIAGLVGGMSGCWLGYTHHTPDEVRRALEGTTIIGSGPESVDTILRSIRLRGGDSLKVGRFLQDGDDRLIEATVEDAAKSGLTRWTVDIVVSFDSLKKASSFKVESSAVNPM